MKLETRRLRIDHPHARALLAQYLEELRVRLGGFDEGRSTSATAAEMDPPGGQFLVLYDGPRPVACGGIKSLEKWTGEIKRMFVVPEARRRGVGRQLLAALEQVAHERGWRRVMLDTAAPLEQAARLYLACGYQQVAPYNDNPYATRWFQKLLGPRGSGDGQK